MGVGGLPGVGGVPDEKGALLLPELARHEQVPVPRGGLRVSRASYAFKICSP